MTDARRLVQAEVENVAGIFLVDEHVVAVVDAEGAEHDAQLLDAFRSTQLTGASLEARMEREVGLPYLAALECARLQLESGFKVAGLLLVTVMQMIRVDTVVGRFGVGQIVLMPNVVVSFRLQ